MFPGATLPQPTLSPVVVYPESDGKPMADNTKQFQWIFVLFGNLAALFRDRADVWVWGNLMWYAKKNEPDENAAPDVFVVFGRPKGHRSSYKQWEENNVPLTVVFEVLSPSNTGTEMDDKEVFYEEHGVEEYYVYDPQRNRLKAYVRQGEVFRRVRPLEGFVSPRLGIRFDFSGPEMSVLAPDGQRFRTFEELKAQEEQEKKLRLAAEQRADQAEQRADQTQQRADQARQRAEAAEQRAARLAELSRKARRGQASAEELAELERLEEPSQPAS
jgi:Uma2 family endonuclease